MPRVTIMIPTYNQSGYVAQAVASALAQDWPDLEVVVGDDCSTDDTPAALAPFAADPRFRYVRQPRNLGRVGNYRSLLYDHAQGDWALNLDGDDWLCTPDFVSQAMAVALRDSGIVAVTGRMREQHPDGSLHDRKANADLPDIMDGRDVFLQLPEERIALYHAATIYRRADAMAIDFYRRPILSADWESLHRLILTGKVGFVSAPAAVWRWHGQNATSLKNADQVIANLDKILGPYAFARDNKLVDPATLEKWFAAMLHRRAVIDAYAFAKRGDMAAYHAYMRRIGELSPSIRRRVAHTPKILVKRLLHML
ncbi:MAG: glycosyltransferase family 2 protein [Desulfovibrionaceae bacterium]